MEAGRGYRIGQMLSAAAVVVSLIFVGMELRQNTLAERAQTRQELANSSRELLLTIASDPTLSRAYAAMYGAMGGFPDSTLTPLDSLQGRFVMFANLRNLENVWLQSQSGVVDDDVLETYAFQNPRLYGSESFRAVWQVAWRNVLDSSFVAAFEEANRLR